MYSLEEVLSTVSAEQDLMEVAQAAEMPNVKGLVDDGLVCRIVSK